MDWIRRYWLVLIAMAVAACASAPMPRDGEPLPPLPPALADPGIGDLRGAYRAALCPRLGSSEDCGRTLHRFAGEPAASQPPPADPSAFRLLFVPGFLATCFSGIDSFADVVAAARVAGYEAQVLDAGGRDSIAANARSLATQIEQIPADGRRLIIIGHSKGAADVLELIVDHPDIALRVVAVIGVAPALMGSPLADQLRGFYRVTLGADPFLICPPGQGDALDDLRLERRREWWAQHGADVRVPVYSIVAVPEFDRVSLILTLPHAMLATMAPYNDGLLIAGDQVAPHGRLLGIVNADHVTAAIPYQNRLPWSLLFRAVDFPRPHVVLAAIDVVVAEKPGVSLRAVGRMTGMQVAR